MYLNLGSRTTEELGWVNGRIVSALRMGTCRAFPKAGPDTCIENALDPVFVLYGEQQIYLNLWSVDSLSISAEQVP